MVKARLAYLNEYNKLMGDVRTETLPQLDKAIGQDSYKLASSEKMKSKKEIQRSCRGSTGGVREAHHRAPRHALGTPGETRSSLLARPRLAALRLGIGRHVVAMMARPW